MKVTWPGCASWGEAGLGPVELVNELAGDEPLCLPLLRRCEDIDRIRMRPKKTARAIQEPWP